MTITTPHPTPDPWAVNDCRDVRPLGPAFCYVPELTDERLLADPYAPLHEAMRAPHKVRRFRLRRFGRA